MELGANIYLGITIVNSSYSDQVIKYLYNPTWEEVCHCMAACAHTTDLNYAYTNPSRLGRVLCSNSNIKIYDWATSCNISVSSHACIVFVI